MGMHNPAHPGEILKEVVIAVGLVRHRRGPSSWCEPQDAVQGERARYGDAGDGAAALNDVWKPRRGALAQAAKRL